MRQMFATTMQGAPAHEHHVTLDSTEERERRPPALCSDGAEAGCQALREQLVRLAGVPGEAERLEAADRLPE
jgi:hypothetical protein